MCVNGGKNRWQEIFKSCNFGSSMFAESSTVKRLRVLFTYLGEGGGNLLLSKHSARRSHL